MTQTHRQYGGGRAAPARKSGSRRAAAPRRRAVRHEDPDETRVWRPEREEGRPRQRTTPPRQAARTAPKRRKRRKSRAPVVLGAVAGLLLALFVLYRLWARAPDIPGSAGVPAPSGTQTEQAAVRRKDGFYTFLLVGRDTGGGGNTDTLMLAAYDTKEQRAALMSIPRDTMVDVSWDVKKINSVYNMYLGRGKEEAAAALEDAVAGLTGFRPDYTVTVEWEAVGEIVEAIGGVWFEVPFDMHYVDPVQDLYIDQAAGYRLLSGQDAMQVVRWRKNNGGVPLPAGADGSDLGRARIQQAFMAAALKQCLQIRNISRLKELAQIFTRRVDTELTEGNLFWFAEKAVLGGFSAEDLYTCTMPYQNADVYSSSYNAYLSYVVPREEELLEEINAHFNPFETDVTAENLNLMRLDGAGGAYAAGGTPLG